MTLSTPDNGLEIPPSLKLADSHNKRPSAASRENISCQSKDPLDIQSILHLPEDAVWGLRKQDLRDLFLKLQKYALNPYPINDDPLASPALPDRISSKIIPQPSLLRLPIEIRQLIYSYLLPPACEPPIRGPHPRQLQTHILLTQPIPTVLLNLNHQTRSEAIPLLYGASSQIIHIIVDYNLWAHRTQRGDIILSSAITSAIKHVDLSIHLGSEKRNSKPGYVEAETRVSEVKKGLKKVRKWLSGADLQTLRISWQEPPQTYTWEQKKDILEGVRPLRPWRVNAGEINWGLSWNKGRKYRFEVAYLKELERGHQHKDVP